MPTFQHSLLLLPFSLLLLLQTSSVSSQSQVTRSSFSYSHPPKLPGRNDPSDLPENARMALDKDGRYAIPMEQRLFEFLFKHYEPDVRPVMMPQVVTMVNISVTLAQIIDLDQRHQKMITTVWLDQEWMDERLRWDPDDWNGIKEIRINSHRVWKPDIVLYNNVEASTDYLDSLVIVSNAGVVFWPPIGKFNSFCRMDITFFPYDQQICEMKFGSWAYTGSQVDVRIRNLGIDLSNYIPNGEWHLKEKQTRRNLQRYPCCPDPFIDLTFYFLLERRLMYYMLNVVTPSYLMSLLAMLSFLLPPTCSEKISLGTTVLLAYTVFLMTVAESLPRTSQFVPLFGLYLTTVMSLTALSTALSTLTINVRWSGELKWHGPPRWLLRMSRILSMNNDHKLERDMVASANRSFTTRFCRWLASKFGGQRHCVARCVRGAVRSRTVSNVSTKNEDDDSEQPDLLASLFDYDETCRFNFDSHQQKVVGKSKKNTNRKNSFSLTNLGSRTGSTVTLNNLEDLPNDESCAQQPLPSNGSVSGAPRNSFNRSRRRSSVQGDAIFLPGAMHGRPGSFTSTQPVSFRALLHRNSLKLRTMALANKVSANVMEGFSEEANTNDDSNAEGIEISLAEMPSVNVQQNSNILKKGWLDFNKQVNRSIEVDETALERTPMLCSNGNDEAVIANGGVDSNRTRCCGKNRKGKKQNYRSTDNLTSWQENLAMTKSEFAKRNDC